MTSAPNSFRAIIGLWQSPDDMASEIGAGVSAVRKWSQRDRIPDEWWQSILDTPTAKAADVTAAVLVALAARKAPAFAAVEPDGPAEARS